MFRPPPGDPGRPRVVTGARRALYFDQMATKLPIGMGGGAEPIYLRTKVGNLLEFAEAPEATQYFQSQALCLADRCRPPFPGNS